MYRTVCDIKTCTSGGLGLIWATTPQKEYGKMHPEETQRCHYLLTYSMEQSPS